MEVALILICSVLAARFLEKRMRVASIAHAILFIVCSVFYLFGSEFKLFVFAAQNMIGKNNYAIIHSALKEGVTFVNFSLSSIYVIEVIVFGTIAIVSTVLFIKGLQKAAKRIKIKSFILKLEQPVDNGNFFNQIVQTINGRHNYLVLGQLRN